MPLARHMPIVSAQWVGGTSRLVLTCRQPLLDSGPGSAVYPSGMDDSDHLPLTGAPDATRDPVCGMRVDPLTSPHHALHAGRSWHFCSARCRERFLVEPVKYTG